MLGSPLQELVAWFIFYQLQKFSLDFHNADVQHMLVSGLTSTIKGEVLRVT